MVAQGKLLVTEQLRADEEVLWVGCSGITTTREQLEGESVCNGLAVIVTILAVVAVGFTVAFLAGTRVCCEDVSTTRGLSAVLILGARAAYSHVNG